MGILRLITFSLNSQSSGLFGQLDTDNVVNFSAEEKKCKEKIGMDRNYWERSGSDYAIYYKVFKWLVRERVYWLVRAAAVNDLRSAHEQEQSQLDNS